MSETRNMHEVRREMLVKLIEFSETAPEPVKGNCAFCGNPSEGNYSVHRDGFGTGPEVPLCDACGGSPTPTLAEIWARIGHNN